MTISTLNNTAHSVATRYLGKAMASASEAAAQLSSGRAVMSAKDDSSAIAIDKQLSASIGALSEASRNTSQGISVLQVASGGYEKVSELLVEMSNLATKANNGSLDAKARGLIQNQFAKLFEQVDNIASQTRWSGVSLLSGGAGATTAAGVVAEGVAGLATLVANTFNAGVIHADSSGVISGAVTDATVTDLGNNRYRVSMTVGGQTFVGTEEGVATGGVLVLTSTTNANNRIAIEYDGADVSGLNSAANYQTALRTAFKVGAGLQPAQFSSGSVAFANGLTAMTAGSSTPAGTYAISSDANGVFTLTDVATGLVVDQKTVATTGAAQTVTFDNGLVASLDNTYASGTPVAQAVFTIAAGANVSIAFQTGEQSTDTVTATVGGVGTAALGLTGINVSTVAGAIDAVTKLSAAINTVNQNLSQVGAQQRQLEVAQDNLDTVIENLKAAKSAYMDVDSAEKMGELTLAKVRAQIGTAMTTQANELAQMIAQAVRV
jgi:flagellin